MDDIDPFLLEALARAIKLAGDMTPDLSTAVRIEAWELAWAPGGLGLIGRVYGHPHIRQGHRALTSTLLAFNPEAGWAVSQNRAYVLGRRRDETLQ